MQHTIFLPKYLFYVFRRMQNFCLLAYLNAAQTRLGHKERRKRIAWVQQKGATRKWKRTCKECWWQKRLWLINEEEFHSAGFCQRCYIKEKEDNRITTTTSNDQFFFVFVNELNFDKLLTVQNKSNTIIMLCKSTVRERLHGSQTNTNRVLVLIVCVFFFFFFYERRIKSENYIKIIFK